jgi:hypothetical protein
MQRFTTAPGGSFIKNIVVDERCDMDEFDGYCKRVGIAAFVSARFRGE